MTTLAPVTKLDCASMSQATAAATSAGVPSRPSGVCAAASSSSCVIAVAIHPGVTALTRIPLRARTLPRLRVTLSSAALLAA